MQQRLDFISYEFEEKNAVLFYAYWLSNATVHLTSFSMEAKSVYKRKLDSVISSVIRADTLSSLRIERKKLKFKSTEETHDENDFIKIVGNLFRCYSRGKIS